MFNTSITFYNSMPNNLEIKIYHNAYFQKTMNVKFRFKNKNEFLKNVNRILFKK